MRATLLYQAGDVRVVDVADPRIEQPTDAVIRIVVGCICGSDLWPYKSAPFTEHPRQMGHEFIGVVEETGSDVKNVKPGELVVVPFTHADNTCEYCRRGLTTSCRHGGQWGVNGVDGGQGEACRIPYADGTLVKLPVAADSELYMSQDTFERAKEPKELVVLDGASHIDLYWKPDYVPTVAEKLAEFFTKNLVWSAGGYPEAVSLIVSAPARGVCTVSVVKINVLSVTPEARATLEQRFAGRAGAVEASDGFEWFELLRPVEGTDQYLVYTRWRSEEDFEKWHASQDFARGHAGGAEGGQPPRPAAHASQIWSFEVVQQAGPKA